MNNLPAVNLCLYQERVKRGQSLKVAAHGIGINKIRLNLIEKGYLAVSKKLEPKFIKYYGLAPDFFTKHSNYVEPLKDKQTKPTKPSKMNKVLTHKATKWVLGGLMVVTAVTLGVGIYLNYEPYIHPRAPWTENFTTFHEKFMNDEDTYEDSGDLVLFDHRYVNVYEKEKYSEGHTLEVTAALYGNDNNSSNTNFRFDYYIPDEGINDSLANAVFQVLCYNNHIIAFTDYVTDEISVSAATCFIENDEYNLRPFFYTDVNGELKKALPGSLIHQEVSDFIKSNLPGMFAVYSRNVLAKKGWAYTNINDLLRDIQKISKAYVKNVGLAFDMTLYSALILALSACMLGLSLMTVRRSKKATVAINKSNDKISAAAIALPSRSLPNDTRVPLVVPEFALRIIGIAILALFAVSLNLAIFWRLNVDFISVPERVDRLQNLSSNILIAAITLFFFLKLDIYHKKSQKELASDVFILFMGGLAFYIVEVVLYTTAVREFSYSANIFNSLFVIITTFLPGNILWNLMFYSLIFYFLFSTPEKYKNQPAKILRFRLLSLLPTLFLLFALIYKIVIEPVAPAPYFISVIFFTKGVLMTLFAIVYLYGIYFLQLHYRHKYGDSNASLIFESRRYAFAKNIMASSIIVVLFLIDLLFRFIMPDNVLMLGNNWAIILLVPFIMFYHPHLGKRSNKLDTLFLALYALFFAGAYLGAINQILSLFDFTELVEILH
ncbi:MAG: hypothetical protein MJ207_00995 [Bacilli bacterium]|nr:hypothetical protein [Bacilli bacterium]